MAADMMSGGWKEMNLVEIASVESSATEATNVASLSILLQTIILGCTFVTGHILRRKNILILHEAGIALLLGNSFSNHTNS